MTQKFPHHVQTILDAAVLHLWDKYRPEPDIEEVSEWLEGDGWDLVVSGLNNSCIYTSRIIDDLNDEQLIENSDIASKNSITDFDRIEYARGHIEHLLSDSMDSFHSIQIDSETMPPAELCFTMYYHPQGGATISGISVCHTHQDYLDACHNEIITDANVLSDTDILTLWKKSEAQLRAWRKRLL